MSLKSGPASKSQYSGRLGSGSLLRDSAAQNILSKNGKTGFGTQTAKSNLDKKNTAVITYDELERIRSQCFQGSSSQLDNEMRTRERLDLQEKSKARVANWPNTIDALRKKKDEERIRRLEEEEIERRKIDALEYEIQVQARQ
jgi:hypothetical protein